MSTEPLITETIGDVLVMTPTIRLDAVGVKAIETGVSDAIVAHKGNIIVDMSNVTFVASLALRMLLTNLKIVQPLGGDVRLCGLQPTVAEVFRKSRFDSLFKMFVDRDAALASYHK
ncbi:MAG: STAS domain-containing protein [Roseiflexaceae bacterium]|nr:STAS domain-containing protein [Roseiflexaceae bacterium]